MCALHSMCALETEIDGVEPDREKNRMIRRERRRLRERESERVSKRESELMYEIERGAAGHQ